MSLVLPCLAQDKSTCHIPTPLVTWVLGGGCQEELVAHHLKTSLTVKRPLGSLSFVYKFQIDFCLQGWEETVDAAIAHLLKTCLSKSSKEQALNLNSQLSIPKDTSRLKKHITLLCDRLAKGGRLCLSADAAAPQAMVMPGKHPAHPP